MAETLVYRRDNVAHLIDEASKAFMRDHMASALRDLADARDSLNVAIAETIWAALDPGETHEPLGWDVVAHALHLSVEDARERYEGYCRRRAHEADDAPLFAGPTSFTSACTCDSTLSGYHRMNCGVYA